MKLKTEQTKSGLFTKIGDGTIWPSIGEAAGDIEHKLRYSQKTLTSGDFMMAASIIEAYLYLIDLPQKKRNEVCEALKNANKSPHDLSVPRKT